MKKSIINTSVYLAGSLILASGFSSQAKTNSDKIKPNIIFFLVDDMGWMDCTVNGSKYYETPNIERLAKRGIVFSSAYTVNPLFLLELMAFCCACPLSGADGFNPKIPAKE